MYGYITGQLVLALTCAYFVFYPLHIYFRDRKNLRRFPSVSVAGVTDLWAALQQYLHRRTLAIHEAHKKHGPIVRVGTGHVSFASLQAVRDIYGHGTPMTKAPFYNAFLSTHFNISDAQDKNIHSVKRRRFAAPLAQKSIVQLENVIGIHLERLIEVLNAQHGQVVDMKRTMMHFMFDFISNFMYAQDPKFLQRNSTVTTAETPDGQLYQTDMYEAGVDAAHLSTCGGWLRGSSVNIWKFATKWHGSWASGARIRDVTIHFVRNRLRMDTELIKQGLPPMDDLLTPMLFDKDGQPLGLELGELITEATNMFNAAGENTEIATTNIIWLLAKNPRAARKLRQELDVAWDHSKTAVPTYKDVKDLPYLRACMDEGLRLRPSIDLGLPRKVPADGMLVGGEWLDGGTTVSVSTHTIHRDATIFHEDPDSYVPERWLREVAGPMQRGFLAFSQGGRACIGRNIAYFEMSLVISLLFSLYDLELLSPDWEPRVDENFSAHVNALPLKLTKRV